MNTDVVENHGIIIEVGPGEGVGAAGEVSIQGDGEGHNGKGEEEGGKGASLFEAISDDNGEIGVMEGKNNVFGVVVQVLESANNVRRALEELKEVPEIGAAEAWEGIVHFKEASGRRRRDGRGNEERGFHLEEGIEKVFVPNWEEWMR